MSLRQLLYHKEFRIKGSGISLRDQCMEDAIKSMENIVSQILEAPADQVDPKFIKEMVTSVWRLEKRMETISNDSALNRFKRALNMMNDVMKNHKIEIKDYTGKQWGPPYDEMPWDNDVEGTGGGTIRMTEPRILLDGKLVQRGKLILEKGEEQ